MIQVSARNDSVALELYNLAADPGETRNLVNSHPNILLALQTLAINQEQDLSIMHIAAFFHACRVDYSKFCSPPGREGGINGIWETNGKLEKEEGRKI